MKSRIAVVLSALAFVVLLSWPLIKVILGESAIPALVPMPEKIKSHRGAFSLHQTTQIVADASSRETAEFLAAQLRRVTSFELPIKSDENNYETKDRIVLTTRGAKPSLGQEGCQLSSSQNSVVIRAPQPAGVFYGTQTLLQLLPPAALGSNAVPGIPWTVPGVEIEDQPRFAWRGFMLDASRHFFNKAEVERILDLMALHKLNTFHWHLTDGQGWRIEIKRYPALT